MRKRGEIPRAILRLLSPQINAGDLGAIVCAAVVGLMIAGSYGAVHDVTTWSISQEYFTRVKFKQFAWADPGMSQTVFAATVGFVAAGAMGGLSGWFLGRRLIPGQTRAQAWRQIGIRFGMILTGTVICGLLGLAWSVWRGPEPEDSVWQITMDEYSIRNRRTFMRVVWIHYGGYLGAIMAFAACLFVQPRGGSKDLSH